MNAPNPSENTALAVASSASAGALLLHEASMERLERIADLMASGKTTVPQHLRGSKGDCFAIALQSMQWGMNPFSVAQKTHLVNGTLGYEAQLVSAVINSSGAVQDRFHFEWFGEWEKIVGKFKEVESKTKTDDNGRPKKFIVPDWKQEDERGLGVRVWATLKGEREPRVLELLMTQARTRNSTLWTEDPKQQIAYLAQKRWSRLYAPDVILGVYTPDELAEPNEKFMGPAEVLPPAPPAAYDQAAFAKNLPAWRKLIEAGRKTADEVIATVEAKAPLTDAQKAEIRAIKAAAAPSPTSAPAATAASPASQVQDVTPKVTYAVIADAIQKSEDHDQLDAAKELIEQIADEGQRGELTRIADERGEKLAF
jgi:hypothetical protein